MAGDTPEEAHRIYEEVQTVMLQEAEEALQDRTLVGRRLTRFG